MKNIYLLIIIFLGLQLQAQENYIQINGSTNVNTFKCLNNSLKTPGGEYNFGDKQLPNISLKVKDFDCKNKLMTSDFQKTLSADEYPMMNIKFLSIAKANNQYNALVEVKMMDKTKTYNIIFTEENGKLISKKNVKFSDFGIKPPKKMGGMIIVKDNLNLQFSLNSKI